MTENGFRSEAKSEKIIPSPDLIVHKFPDQQHWFWQKVHPKGYFRHFRWRHLFRIREAQSAVNNNYSSFVGLNVGIAWKVL
jgi:hypothetical protein